MRCHLKPQADIAALSDSFGENAIHQKGDPAMSTHSASPMPANIHFQSVTTRSQRDGGIAADLQ
jgi:hypothetical protein